MINHYYEKYWQEKKDISGHDNNTPQWPKKELALFYNAVVKYIGKNILDIGSGEGIFLEYLQNRNNGINSLSALEISSFAIERGKKRNPSVSYYLGSADEVYPFLSDEFDTLFMTDVIEHLVDVDEALSESNRVLKKNGILIILTPTFNWLKKMIIAAFFWEKFFYPNNPHIRFFTKKSMDSIMQKHGFKRVYYKWGLSWFGIMPQNAYFVYEKVS